MNKELVNPYLLTYKNGEGISPYQNQYQWFETEEELRGSRISGNRSHGDSGKKRHYSSWRTVSFHNNQAAPFLLKRNVQPDSNRAQRKNDC